MKKTFHLSWILIFLLWDGIFAQNAPITTVGTIVSTATTATIPVTAINFTNIGSFNLKLIYNHAVVTVTSVTAGPLLGGFLTTDLTHTDTISLGWFTYPGDTLSANSVIFNIAVTQVTGGCMSAITWYDNGYSCVWYNGNFALLNDTPTSTYYINGSITFAFPLVADFVAGNTTPPKNTTVQLTDLTTGCPASWTWSFDRTSVNYVNGTNAQSQNPQVQFTDGGLYTVTLVVHNAYYTDTKVKTGYIRAGIAGLWTGNTSSDWMILSNWDNWLVPDITTNVAISSQTSNGPSFNGDLTVGTQCNNLSLTGASQLTVTGCFTISTGHSLTFTGSGAMKVGGNWSDSGSFISGTGSVEFFGANPGSILAPANEIFYNLIENKSGTSLTIPHNVTVNGDVTVK